MEEEIWKDVIGYEGKYQVSNLGRIKSMCKFKSGIMKQNTRKNNMRYYDISLMKDDKKKTYQVHRIVAKAFIPNPENKPQVNHKDGNKLNNNINNLERVTRSENIRHSYDVLGFKSTFQTNHPKNMLGKFGKEHSCSKAVIQYNLQGNFIKERGGILDVTRALKINPSSISAVCKGKRNKAGGFIWKYK